MPPDSHASRTYLQIRSPIRRFLGGRWKTIRVIEADAGASGTSSRLTSPNAGPLLTEIPPATMYAEAQRGYPMGTESHRVELSIPMIPEMELAASRTAGTVAELMNLDGDRAEEVTMAFIEACLYTFQEGSPDKRAHICFCMYEDRLEAYLHALGEEIDLERVIERQDEMKVLPLDRKCWGLRILEGLMDRAELLHLEEGHVIRMIKYQH